jgi:hypothetical protein
MRQMCYWVLCAGLGLLISAAGGGGIEWCVGLAGWAAATYLL